MILTSHLTALNSWYNNIDWEKDLARVTIVRSIESKLRLSFAPEYQELSNVCMINHSEVRDEYKDTFKTVDLLDYIYALLHSEAYRNKYEARAKIDYSMVPCPKDPMFFWQLVGIGTQLRILHLLESPTVGNSVNRYSLKGGKITIQKPIISKACFEPYDSSFHVPPEGYQQQEDSGETATLPKDIRKPVGKIWINKTQYFVNIPQMAWEFCVGGHRPAQKWLKDRCGSILELEDIKHYQKIIVALTETLRLRQNIGTIIK